MFSNDFVNCKQKSLAMAILNAVISWIIKKRIHQIELFIKYPHEVQNEWLKRLLNDAKDTEWGRKYDFKNIDSLKIMSR